MQQHSILTGVFENLGLNKPKKFNDDDFLHINIGFTALKISNPTQNTLSLITYKLLKVLDLRILGESEKLSIDQIFLELIEKIERHTLSNYF